MAFIRERSSPTSRRTPSYQVIETYRESGKVKQRVLANLGRFPTVGKALDHCRESLASAERGLARQEQRGPRGGGRYVLSHRKALDWYGREIEKKREHLRRLEAVVSERVERVTVPVVSEISRRRHILDTTRGGNESCIAVSHTLQR